MRKSCAQLEFESRIRVSYIQRMMRGFFLRLTQSGPLSQAFLASCTAPTTKDIKDSVKCFMFLARYWKLLFIAKNEPGGQ